MARVGIAITKSCAFRDAVQEFTNVYYYDGLAGTPSSTEAAALIDQAATREKAWHSSLVTFVRGKCWLETGVQATSVMLEQHNLSGTGSSSTAVSGKFDRERAFLFRLRAGSDSRGNPVYLRKWYHACGCFGAQCPPDAVVDNTTGFTQTMRDALVAIMNSIGAIGSGTTAGVLCAKSGRLPTAGQTWTSHKYLEHHQLGDMWR